MVVTDGGWGLLVFFEPLSKCSGGLSNIFLITLHSIIEYIKKAQSLLDQPEYKSIPNDPTNRYKNKLISILKSLKAEGGMNEVTYRRLYPTGASLPRFYVLPKVHKQGMPLRPIVSSVGAVMYQTAKELSKILKPLVGKSPHHVHNNEEFLQYLKGI